MWWTTYSLEGDDDDDDQMVVSKRGAAVMSNKGSAHAWAGAERWQMQPEPAGCVRECLGSKSGVGKSWRCQGGGQPHLPTGAGGALLAEKEEASGTDAKTLIGYSPLWQRGSRQDQVS